MRCRDTPSPDFGRGLLARGNDVQLGGITDLVLLADIRRVFVDALEVATYVDRLRKVLRTLYGLRLVSR